MGTLNTEKVFQLASKGKTLSFLLSLGLMEPGSQAVPTGAHPQSRSGTTVPLSTPLPREAVQFRQQHNWPLLRTNSHCPLCISGYCSGFRLLKRQTAHLGQQTNM